MDKQEKLQNEITMKSHEKLVLVDCFTSWCGPCMALAHVIDELEKEYNGKVIFYRIDVETYSDFAIKNNIRAVPFLLFFKNGKRVSDMVGNTSKRLLSERIESLL